MLLSKGADTDLVDDRGWSVLHHAAQEGRGDVEEGGPILSRILASFTGLNSLVI